MKSTSYLNVMLGLFVLLCYFSCKNESQTTKSTKEMKAIWSGVPGDPNFSAADKLAIYDVMNAFGVYWDNRNIDDFISLFTDDGYLILPQADGADIQFSREKLKEIGNNRFEEYASAGLQQRHFATNTHFIEQRQDSAHIEQYVLLVAINDEVSLSASASMIYDVWLKKVKGIWKISKYIVRSDVKMDLPKNE